MADNETFDWRRSDRRLFATAAIIFPAVVLIGFARTYYLKFAFDTPPLPSLLVHLHGLLMTLWVGFFISQVWLIRSKSHRIHMNLGRLGIALAAAMILVGFFTAVAAAKYGSPSTPPGISPLSFLIVPLVDMLLFGMFFGAAVYYRKNAANHKRMMLLTVLNFLPPAVARFPVASLQAVGPLLFFGLPTILAVGLLVYDTWRNRKLNVPFLVGAIVLVASYPLRMIIAETDMWLGFAAWLTTWGA
ncbi:MAG: hypothetical protein ABR530_09970 [Pyrinomonadaceae bacterium]